MSRATSHDVKPRYLGVITDKALFFEEVCLEGFIGGEFCLCLPACLNKSDRKLANQALVEQRQLVSLWTTLTNRRQRQR